MFKLVRTIINNFNETNYLKNISKLRYKPEERGDLINNKTIDLEASEMAFDRLEFLEQDLRHKNIKVFISNMATCRLKQFFVYTVPAIIVAADLALFTQGPTKIEKETLEAFTKDTITFVDDKQIEEEDNNTYYKVMFSRDYVGDMKKDAPLDTSTAIDLYLTENLEGYHFKVFVKEDGTLIFNSIESGYFADLKDYSSIPSTEIEDKYVELFDKIVEIALDGRNLTQAGKDELKAISDSEKKHLVATLVQYNSLSEQEVEVRKDQTGLKFSLLVVLGVYIFIINLLKNKKFLFKSDKLFNNNGTLDIAFSEKEEQLLFLALKYKEAFIDAEERRIKRIIELLEFNFEVDTAKDILSNYEKKLIIK